MISLSSSIRKTALSASSTSESMIRSNGLGRSGSCNHGHIRAIFYVHGLTRRAVIPTAPYHFDKVQLT